jgi:predicted HNH restriction endonuclease
LREGTRVTLSGLLTVCANCHRMLHRLGGGQAAVSKLRRIVALKSDRPGA